MDSLVVGLLAIIALLVVVLAVILVQRGGQTRALEDRLGQLQRGLVELQAGENLRRSDSQLLATRIEGVQSGLVELRAFFRARQDVERTTLESVRRLEAVIAGTQTKGAAGENILEVVFAQLPAAWQERNFMVGNRVVEFGLRLPNDLVLPIDSKWAATPLLERFIASESVDEQQVLKRQIERAVVGKAREVRKYIDPNLTTPFGVAVVPDAVYDLCGGIQADVFRLNVVLISYSLFVPYLLLVFQTVLRSSYTVDMHRLEAYLNNVQDNLDALQSELEGRYARALRMLSNSGNEMRTHLSQLRGGLAGVQIATARAEEEDILLPASRSSGRPPARH